MTVTLEQARRVKAKAKSLTRSAAPDAGIGLAKIDGSYVVKINLRAPVKARLPEKVDGVPVLYEVVGSIKPRHAD